MINSFEVLDITGKVMLRKEGIAERKQVVCIDQLEDGMYLLKLESVGEIITRKFVKQ